jgi:hypothetical protein
MDISSISFNSWSFSSFFVLFAIIIMGCCSSVPSHEEETAVTGRGIDTRQESKFRKGK